MNTKNWTVIIESLFSDLEDNGFFPQYVFDGEETVNGTRQELIEAITGVDESKLYVEKEDVGSYMLYIVLGNEAHETVADFTDNKDLEKVICAWSESWNEIFERKSNYPPFY